MAEQHLDISDIRLTLEEERLYVDLRPVLNSSPVAVQRSTHLEHVYRLFRTMGLRHLIVIESHPKVLGIITRKVL